MKKIINAVIGDTSKASPARKYTAYALLGTAVAFALALVILIASSIAFAVIDGKQAEIPENNETGEGDVVTNKAITYGVVSADVLGASKDELVILSEERTVLDGGLYYGISPKSSLKLTSSAADALDRMLVAFYNAKKLSLNVSTEDESKCDLPLITDASSDGLSFNIERYIGNDKSIADAEFKSKYEWIFTNARSYGFIYNDNKFQYVGTVVASYMNTKKLTDLDAFVNALKANTSNVSITVSKVSYQMYYLAADAELKVPTNYAYEVLADGTNGYIIIVNMSKRIEAPSDAG